MITPTQGFSTPLFKNSIYYPLSTTDHTNRISKLTPYPYSELFYRCRPTSTILILLNGRFNGGFPVLYYCTVLIVFIFILSYNTMERTAPQIRNGENPPEQFDHHASVVNGFGQYRFYDLDHLYPTRFSKVEIGNLWITIFIFIYS
jgi:hypothetical protein